MPEPYEIKQAMAFDRDYIMAGNRREQVRLAGNAVTPPAARDWMRRPSPWRIWKLFAMSTSAPLSFFVMWSVITLCRRCARTRLNIASAACFCCRPAFRARNIAMASRTSFASSSRTLRCTRACKRSVRLSHRQLGITDRGLGITEGGRGRPSPPSRLTQARPTTPAASTQLHPYWTTPQPVRSPAPQRPQ